jgi:TRAP-type C4-dicarboxylate transport system substrate-binding protein
MQQSNTRAWQWRFLTMATIAATLCFFAGSVCAQTYKGPALTLTMASGTNKNIARGKQWNHFAELVEQMTAGKVKVRVFYDGALYGEHRYRNLCESPIRSLHQCYALDGHAVRGR